MSAVYSPEQQSRLGVDAQGQPANGTAAAGEPQPMCKCDAGWSGAQCESHDACLSVSCGTNGRCHEGTCECRDGWSGQDCSVDPCAGVACGSHGHCAAGVCHCDLGYSGSQCSAIGSAATANSGAEKLLSMLGGGGGVGVGAMALMGVGAAVAMKRRGGSATDALAEPLSTV